MTTYYVRTTGSDSNSGSVDFPFLTVQKGILAAASDDVVDVGPGNFTETLTSTIVQPFVEIKGAGSGQTRIIANTASALFDVNSVNVQLVLLRDLSLVQSASGIPLVQVTTLADQSRVMVYRCLLKPKDSYAIEYNAANSLASRIEVLNCVITSADRNRQGIAFISTQKENGILVRNSVMRRLALVVDDVAAAEPIDLDFNVYSENSRNLRVGQFGVADLKIDGDLGFVSEDDGNYRLLVTSVLRDRGVDLAQGYGNPAKFPIAAMAYGFTSTHPDIGLDEIIYATATLSIRSSNMTIITELFAEGFDAINGSLATIKKDRSTKEADAPALQQRFGDLLDLYRV